MIPAGTGQTELQLTVIERVRPGAYTGTPSFLKILLERGRAERIDTSCLTKALVGGEAFPGRSPSGSRPSSACARINATAPPTSA